MKFTFKSLNLGSFRILRYSLLMICRSRSVIDTFFEDFSLLIGLFTGLLLAMVPHVMNSPIDFWLGFWLFSLYWMDGPKPQNIYWLMLLLLRTTDWLLFSCCYCCKVIALPPLYF